MLRTRTEPFATIYHADAWLRSLDEVKYPASGIVESKWLRFDARWHFSSLPNLHMTHRALGGDFVELNRHLRRHPDHAYGVNSAGRIILAFAPLPPLWHLKQAFEKELEKLAEGA